MRDRGGPRGGPLPIYGPPAISGLLLAAASPNPLSVQGFGPLCLVALSPFLFALSPRLPLAAAQGAILGFVAALTGAAWLSAFHPLALLLYALILSTRFAAFGFVASLLQRSARRPGLLAWLRPAALGGLCFALERLGETGYFGQGFGVLAAAWPDSPLVARTASLGGAAFAGSMILLANLAVAEGLRGLLSAPAERRPDAPPPPGSTLRDEGQDRPRVAAPKARPGMVRGSFTSAIRRAAPPLVWLAAILALAFLLRPSPPASSVNLRVGIVQQGFLGYDEGRRGYEATIRRLLELSEEAALDGAELVLWPETAVIPSFNRHRALREDPALWALLAQVEAFPRGTGAALLFGTAWTLDPGKREPVGSERAYNAALLLSPEGRESLSAKRKLVPLAESLPAGALGSWLARFGRSLGLELPRSPWIPGSEAPLLELAATESRPALKFGSLICFEDGFPRLAAEHLAAGADFLAVLTSDAWARSRLAEAQHLALSRLRAAETGLPLLRAASTGASGVYLPGGESLGSLPAAETGLLVLDLPLAPGARRRSAFLLDRPLLAALLALFPALALLVAGALPPRRPR